MRLLYLAARDARTNSLLSAAHPLVTLRTDVESSTHVSDKDSHVHVRSIRNCDFLFLFLTVQLQSSGPPFKGLAVQSRTSTAQFDGNASFVGSFLNGGLDWKLWNCDSVS